jgi:hypothetical protein
MPLEPPYVVAAVFCDKVLHEKDGVLSAIRIVDRLTAVLEVPPGAAEPPAIQASLTLLVVLRNGSFKGSGKLSITATAPSGNPLANNPAPVDVEFKSPHTGANVIATVSIPVKEEGAFWFDVLFEGRILMRTPLYVAVSRSETPSGSAPVVPH